MCLLTFARGRRRDFPAGIYSITEGNENEHMALKLQFTPGTCTPVSLGPDDKQWPHQRDL